MAQAFFGGVHPNDMKAATNEKAIEQLSPPPAQVVIPMSMHFGAPCTPIVSVGDYVKVGQKIGEFKGLGAPIHASVSGKVVAIEPRPYSMGGNMTSVVIENDYQNTVSEEVKAPADPNALTTEEMIEIVKNAGIVGMGGATFPTHVKISGGIGQVTTVIINGAECEPYITGDHRAMLERTEEIIGGASYLVKMFGVDKAIIGVEDNKQNGIDAMRKVIAEKNQGAEQENGRRAQAAQPLLLHRRFPRLSFRFFYYSIVKKSCQTVRAARPFRKSPFKINGQTCAACQPDRSALILSKVPNSSAGFHFLRSESGA